MAICAICWLLPAAADDVLYHYDALGRLEQVINPDGTSVTYSFDPAGNISAVRKAAADAVSIAGFRPSSGLVGTSVTINGSGFDATVLANNVVTINGMAASVSAATANTLTFTIPASATSGIFAISNRNGSATSINPFIVVASSEISSFTPDIGTIGIPVQITGTNFPIASAGVKVLFGGQIAASSVTAPSSISTFGTNSGKVVVKTLFGDAVSATDFYALPSGTTAADIAFKSRIALDGGNQTISLPSMGKKALLIFDGVREHYASFQFSSFTVNPVNASVAYLIYKPDGSLLTSGNITATSLSIHLPKLPASGTYTLLLTPATSTLTTLVKLVSCKEIAIDGTVDTMSLSENQTGRSFFSGTAGQNLGIGLTDSMVSRDMAVTINKPDGTVLFTFTTFARAVGAALPSLPVTGTYTVMFNPGPGSASLNALLSSELTGSLAINGAAATFSPSRVGQTKSYRFSAATGQTIILAMTGDTLAGSTYANVYTPDGTLLDSKSLSYGTGAATSRTITLPTFPVTGDYRLQVVSDRGGPGSITVGLTAETTGTLTLDGTPAAISLLPGQKARYIFSGTSGQHLGIGLTALNLAPAGSALTVTINNPNGTLLTSFTTSNVATGTSLPALPATGAYTVVLSAGQSAASFYLLTSSDITGSLALNGPALTFAPTRVGQAASFIFSGTAGQNANVSMRDDTLAGFTYLYVYKPDGRLFLSTYLYYVSGAASSNTVVLTNLPVAGTYRVQIVPAAGGPGSITVALKETPTSPLTVDGAATAVNLVAGQNGSYPFNGTKGQRLGLGVTELVTRPAGGTVALELVKPDGGSIGSCSNSVSGSTGGCVIDPLPMSGIYTVNVTAQPSSSATLNVSLISDITTTLVVNGSPATLAPARVGQTASFSFAGTAGQNLDLALSNMRFPLMTYFYVYPPDQPYFAATVLSGIGSSTRLALPSLPVSGSYIVRSSPIQGAIGSVTAAIESRP